MNSGGISAFRPDAPMRAGGKKEAKTPIPPQPLDGRMKSRMMRIMKSFLWILVSFGAGFLVSCGSRQSSLSIVGLRCENRENPAGVSVSRPHFSWLLASTERGQVQTAYQIQVAASNESLENGRADVWDSGKRRSSENLFIPYEGPTFDSGNEYFWRVRAWDRNKRPTGWSPTASFITELPDEPSWSGARWIAFEEFPDSLKLVPGVHGKGDDLGEVALKRPVVPCFRKEFELEDTPKRAFAFVSGLGHYELRINGRKVGDAFLAPGWTDYRKTCLYNTYDITPFLKKGKNAVGLVVGNGFFHINRERYRKLVIAYGLPMMILNIQAEVPSGRRETLVSGPEWKTAPSPITYSSIYGGEDYDARLEDPGWDEPGFDDSLWKNAVSVPGPGGALRPEKDHPLRVMEEFQNTVITEPRQGVFVYDFGQNASGIVRLRVKGPRGSQVRIIPAEILTPEGLADQRASGEPFLFTYTLRGEGEETWVPRFTYYGFRYAQVEGASPAGREAADGRPQILDLTLLHTRNSSPAEGAFQCSNPLFNRIEKLIGWAIKSNLASVPTDCPHREKLGWLEQAYLMGGAMAFNFEVLNLFNKLVDDMIEAQLETGLIPDIAPEFVPFEDGFRDSPEWGSACVILPWLIHRYYGDRKAIERAYPMMKRYADYLKTKADGHILRHGLGDWYDLGPNPPGPSQLTPIGLTATATYIHDLDLIAATARLLDRREDAANYERRARLARDAFQREFFDPEKKIFGSGSQTSNAMPLALRIVREEDREAVLANLVRSIREGGNALTAGDIGYHYLIRALAEGGASDLIFEMNSRSDVPGYGYQLAKGATALTESWAAREDVSNNHMMLGHLMEWLYSGLAGIGQADDSVGFKKIVIHPNPVGDITWVKAKYHCLYGDIRCDWKIDGGTFVVEVEIPVNTRAEVHLPARDPASVTESGRSIERSREIKFLGIKDGRPAFGIGSGIYVFACPWNPSSD